MTTMSAHLLDLYSRIDIKTTHHYERPGQKQAPCAKGCSSCCSQFFEISLIEFILIINHLKSLEPDTLSLFKENARQISEAFKTHYPDFANAYFNGFCFSDIDDSYYQHPQRFKVHMPCVFLSKEGACGIYPVRPLTCRTTGVGYKKRFEWGSICNVIRHGIFAPLWQADLREFVGDIEDIAWVESDQGYIRQYPMFYFMDQFFNIDPLRTVHPLVQAFDAKTQEVFREMYSKLNTL